MSHLSTQEAAERLALERRYVQRLAAKGCLRAERQGRAWRIDAQHVAEVLEHGAPWMRRRLLTNEERREAANAARRASYQRAKADPARLEAHRQASREGMRRYNERHRDAINARRRELTAEKRAKRLEGGQ